MTRISSNSNVPARTPGSRFSGLQLLAVCFRKFFNFVGYSGALFVIYGAVAHTTDSAWSGLESWMIWVSSLLTILGALITAATVYLRVPNPVPPERFSKVVSAPVVIACCVIAIVVLLRTGRIPQVVVNGFALLAISGAFFRIQTRPVSY